MSKKIVLIISLVLASGLILSGCSNSKKEEDGERVRNNPLKENKSARQRKLERLSALELYLSAKEALKSGDNTGALELYGVLQTRYPFTRFSTQAQLDSIYAHYRQAQHEEAQAAANRFLKQHPRHDSVDYVYYLKGSSYYERSRDAFEKILQVDSSERDPIYARLSFETYSLLLSRFPDSDYSQDARKRMVYLRNVLARYELHVADFYVQRRAWVAASRRAQHVVEQFQGTTSVAPALAIMEHSYSELGLNKQASDARAVLNENFPNFDQNRVTQNNHNFLLRWLDGPSEFLPPPMYRTES